MQKTIIIACSIFKNELNEIHRTLKFSPEIIYLDSMLHMKPQKLDNSLTALLEKHNAANIVLLYGDCYPGISEVEKKSNVYRLSGINCINITMENSRYKQLRKEGAFILMDEWLSRWKEVFQEELGFKTRESATEFMQEMHTKVVYLDTGNQEIPYQTLEDISAFVGLPYSIEKSNPSILSQEITKAINYFSHAE